MRFLVITLIALLVTLAASASSPLCQDLVARVGDNVPLEIIRLISDSAQKVKNSSLVETSSRKHIVGKILEHLVGQMRSHLSNKTDPELKLLLEKWGAKYISRHRYFPGLDLSSATPKTFAELETLARQNPGVLVNVYSNFVGPLTAHIMIFKLTKQFHTGDIPETISQLDSLFDRLLFHEYVRRQLLTLEFRDSELLLEGYSNFDREIR